MNSVMSLCLSVSLPLCRIRQTLSGMGPGWEDVRWMESSRIWMQETDEWLAHLSATGRKQNTLRTHRNNVRQCLQYLQWLHGEPEIHAADITEDDVQFLWSAIPVKEEVRSAYLRSLACMIEYHTGQDVVKRTDILHNREVRDRIFVEDHELRTLWGAADPEQRMIIAFGAYMGLRRCEMQGIREGDIDGDRVTIHGKGHGNDGLVMTVRMPEPVKAALERYRVYKANISKTSLDDFVLQSRDHKGRLHRIHEAQITAAITRLSRATGVRATTHSLRRYYGTTLYYKGGCDLQTVRKLMRHADISTTLKCYIDAYDVKEREAEDRLTAYISTIITPRG